MALPPKVERANPDDCRHDYFQREANKDFKFKLKEGNLALRCMECGKIFIATVVNLFPTVKKSQSTQD